MPTQRANGRFYIKRNLPGVGRLYKSLHTDRKAVARRCEDALVSLHQQGRHELVRAFDDGDVSIQQIQEAYESGRTHELAAEIRRNEVRKVIEGGLDDISVSRTRLPWGVPWPGDEEQTVYVWLDALTNYLSAIGFPDPEYRRFWPADVHVIGKDITRFHCIYWPAFLLSAGVDLPRTVWAHGFVTYGGRRMSKSEGVTYGLDEAIEQHGPEPLRYYLLREVPWDGDGDITRERFDERYTAELANDLGNLANRVLAMVERYRDGVVPEGGGTRLRERSVEAVSDYREAMDAQLLHRGIDVARALTSAANVFVEEQAPWALARDEEGADELDRTLGDLVHALAVLATLHHPYLPGRMKELADRLGLDEVPSLAALSALSLAGCEVRKGDPLFPRPDSRRP